MSLHYRLATAAAIILAATAPLQAQEAGTVEDTAPVLTVEVATPQISNWPVRVRASGWLAPWQEAIIASEVNGQKVEAVHVDIGSTVEKGQLLAELSSTLIENKIRQEEAAMRSAEASLEEATANADRARNLSESGSISEKSILQFSVSERQAAATLASAKAALASSQLDLEHTSVRAVDDGVISSRTAALGSVVSAGQELFRLIRQNKIEWQAEVPLRHLSQISEGTAVTIPSPVGEVPGKVRLITPSASSVNGRVKVYVTLDQPSGAAQPPTGILVSGFFELGETEAMNVPAGAIVQSDGFSYVFVLQPGAPDTVSRLKVETGRRLGTDVEILNGIQDDMQVVQAGGAFLSDGAVVRVVNSLASAQN